VLVDQSINSQNRRARRSPVLLAATVEIAGTPEPVKLRNLSTEGALVEGERLPIEGSTSFFHRNELRVKCRVAWVQGRYAGLAFEQPLEKEQVLRNVPAPRPRVNSPYRRPGFANRPLTLQERRMIEELVTALPISSLD